MSKQTIGELALPEGYGDGSIVWFTPAVQQDGPEHTHPPKKYRLRRSTDNPRYFRLVEIESEGLLRIDLD